MIIKGKLFAEAPIYRGNARKTLFTRDGDGTHRLVSLAGEISGTAQALMDAFVGQSKNGKNTGLLNQLWGRLYGSAMPDGIISKVECKLDKGSYPKNNFFDMRMGIKLDEDRWAAEANANYKMETVLRHSNFEMVMEASDSVLQKGDNSAKLYYLLKELQEGRFWFGAGKSKGLGRLRLTTKLPIPEPDKAPTLRDNANHLTIDFSFNSENPILVGWNWGKIDPETAAFSAVEGRQLVEAMKDLPAPVRERLEMALGGAILNPDDWKTKFADFLPRITAIWLNEQSSGESEAYVLPESAIAKLSKGKHALQKKLLNKIKPFADQPFESLEAADEAFKEALGKKANMAKRVTDLVEKTTAAEKELNQKAWNQVADGLGMDKEMKEKAAARLSEKLNDELGMIKALTPAMKNALPRLYEQVDQQIRLLQSDAWVEEEIRNREEHMLIKKMLKEGKITEYQWNDPGMVPEGIRSAIWREFLDAHNRVQYRHMLNEKNLNKSITNDKNQIEFLKTYRDRTRQELAQPHHIDFRAGGPANRVISKKYGKPYDTVFMRMLSWAPSQQEEGSWEIYIPGSTIKGAFRKRASQALKTLWGDNRKTQEAISALFGAQGRRGIIFFSDAYLKDPDDSGKSWCSMDGIRMDPKTGQPVETAKRDYLFAYGDKLRFHLRMDLQDISDKDLELISILFHLIEDFQRGDIPLGGEKTSGFGWAEVRVEGLTWLTGSEKGVTGKLFENPKLEHKGAWQAMTLESEAAKKALTPIAPITAEKGAVTDQPPVTPVGFISHRSFGGNCGTLHIDAELLTPMNIQESGEPTATIELEEGPVNGWDFFSMSPPENDLRETDRVYAMPGRSIKGMIRHIYSITTDTRAESKEIGKLNPADSLFGWVGNGPNQALMGRLSFGFATFEPLQKAPAWFKVPYPYGEWEFTAGKWTQRPDAAAQKLRIAGHWRIFPNVPLAPIVETLDDFKPDTVAARYFRALLPGEKARFTLRFWNLTDEELGRLLWCILLEEKMAHKMGNNRYLGFGSLRLSLAPESFLIDWENRYAKKAESEWRRTVEPEKFMNAKYIAHYNDLKQGLNADAL